MRKKIPKKIQKKCLAVPKKIERGDSLVSPGMICYAEKQVKPFWSSSLGQMVQFDTIIFCRTFKNYFGQFVWIEKKSHYNSRVSLHEAPTKNHEDAQIIQKPDVSNIKCVVLDSKVLSVKTANPFQTFSTETVRSPKIHLREVLHYRMIQDTMQIDSFLFCTALMNVFKKLIA